MDTHSMETFPVKDCQNQCDRAHATNVSEVIESKHDSMQVMEMFGINEDYPFLLT